MRMLCKVKLSEHKYKTPEGYLYCKDAIIARTGKQTYLESEVYEGSTSNDYIEIDRSEKEVFSPETMASFENKPLTIEHPDVSVGPENYKDLSVGHIQNVRKGEYEGKPVMMADIMVNDAEAIRLIESGEMTELSCGYDCDITSGDNPEQINIRGNHVALCEAGRAGIAMIVDSKPWGIKSVQDSVNKGTLIQEFGKQGKQYKITKIVGNVIYAENLTTEAVVLFKKDEENIEWAVINKSDVKDSKTIKDYEHITLSECSYCYGLSEEELNQIWKKINKESSATIGANPVRRVKRFVNREKRDEFISQLPKESEPRSDEFDYTIEVGKDNYKWLIYWEVYYWDWNTSIQDDNELVEINKNELSETDKELLNKIGRIAKDIALSIKKHYPEIENVNADMIVADIVRDLGLISGKININSLGNTPIDNATKYLFENYNMLYDLCEQLFGITTTPEERLGEALESLDSPMFSPEAIDAAIGSNRFLECARRGRIPYIEPEEINQLTYTANDSEPKQYVISLGKNNGWLDINDKPVNDIKQARKFLTEEEAKAHCNTYCKGEVCTLTDDNKEINDSVSYQDKVKELLKDIKYKDMKEDSLMLTINFNDKSELKKAANLLKNDYDIELVIPDLSINVYDKLVEDNFLKDSEEWAGFDLLRGPASKDFKQYLRDRGLYFEPSSNGDYVHFEVKNADEDVYKQVDAIREHWGKFHDSYSKKFYSKMIKELEDRLKKLEKNELLDENNHTYEKQKNSMREEIKKQIDEYRKKLEE